MEGKCKTEIVFYIDDYMRRNYISTLNQIKDFFRERLLPLIDPEKESEDYVTQRWESEMNASGDENTDTADIAEHVTYDGIDKYEMLSLMKYLILSSWIACMYQIWEQQLNGIIIRTFKTSKIDYRETDKEDVFKFIKNVLKDKKIIKLIDELNYLVNVIKHAEGHSEIELRKLRPDYFQNIDILGKCDPLSTFHSSLLEITLQINYEDFSNYNEALVTFWKELPKTIKY